MGRLLVLFTLGIAACSHTAIEAARQDAALMEAIARANLAEIAAGNLAVRKAHAPQVRQFGERVVDEHSALLKGGAGLAGVAVPTTPGARHEPALKQLESLSLGTVGAVAIDRAGTIAAGTSTGGTAGKLPGRVGDSALIGCGTYAESTRGGVSCTGDGEAIIRVALARQTLEILKSVGDPDHACEVALSVLVEEGRGEGGLIVLDWKGRMAWANSTPLMPVARPILSAKTRVTSAAVTGSATASSFLGASRPSTRLASVMVGSVPPRP